MDYLHLARLFRTIKQRRCGFSFEVSSFPLGAMLKEKRDKLLDGVAGYEKDVRPINKGN